MDVYQVYVDGVFFCRKEAVSEAEAVKMTEEQIENLCPLNMSAASVEDYRDRYRNKPITVIYMCMKCKKDIVEWTCTDPDQQQYGRKIKDGHYQFKEKPHHPNDDYEEGEMVEMDIILAHYTREEMWHHVKAYYTSMQEVYDTYGDEAEWIIAECIFEQETQY